LRFVYILLLVGASQLSSAHEEFVCPATCESPPEVMSVPEPAEPESSDKDEFSGGTLRLGAFFIDDIKTQVYFGPSDIPLRAAIDIRKDLGAKDSLTAFRLSFMYRFSKRHALSLGYYELDLDGIIRLGRTIELGETEFDIGVDVRSEYNEQVTKLAYNYIFHDEGPVMLAITPGIHFSKARFSMKVSGLLGGGLPALEVSENKSVAAPLPMIGGRLVYRLSPKWKLIASSDIFFLDRGSQEGQLTDTNIVVEYETKNGFVIGGGLNRFSLDLQVVDDDIIWDWSSVYTGVHLYVGYSF
jgi:hypothetical protein